ncbi:pyridoxamine 5'-phosphate oxidase family protein [Paenibacillus chitinolyticus]|uniref:pyridoxamine 5'-phosphate oxidase family protein n=1 Tax=Paenibacillus chitinolyticus TaxID=79263 RepID=UPI0036D81FEB
MNVFHQGERIVQNRVGARAAADRVGRMIQPFIPTGFEHFLQQQSIVVLASTDAAGAVWASLITGDPGMIRVKNPKTIEIRTLFTPQDPCIRNIQYNENVGLIIIDFEHQIRIRVNGTAKFIHDDTLRVEVEQVYGNCPKHIQKRSLTQLDCNFELIQTSVESGELTSEHKRWIENADTFFIASSGPEGKADASHRGGNPGFVKTLGHGALVFPDYSGNMLFNTLGNIEVNPHTGILFLDFESGQTLQLTGRSKIVWEICEKERLVFPGAQRLIEFQIDRVIQTEHVIPFKWDLLE